MVKVERMFSMFSITKFVKKISLKLNGMNDSLVIYVRNDTFDSIDNEFRV